MSMGSVSHCRVVKLLVVVHRCQRCGQPALVLQVLPHASTEVQECQKIELHGENDDDLLLTLSPYDLICMHVVDI